MDCNEAFAPPPLVSTPSSPWLNWSGTQEVYANSVVRPRTLAELIAVLKETNQRGGRARVVATGLSFSDILQADDVLIEATGLFGDEGAVLLPLENELWTNPVPPEPLVRIVCGARIRHLNATLACAGLAFENLGGYDGQTMIGAISTSTHGSGVHLPPLADAVRALDLVTADGMIHHIEPSNGLTCRRRFDQHYHGTRLLEQCDDTFRSAIVSLGCMGVIYSVTMQVRSAFRLRERRKMRKWCEVVKELQSADSPLFKARNYEVLINPYRGSDGKHDCLVTERNLAEPDARTVSVPKVNQSAVNITFMPSAQSVIPDLMQSEPRLIPGLLQTGLEVLATTEDNVDDSFIVYNIGSVNTAHVMSGEYFFPLCGDQYLVGIQKLLDAVERNRQTGIYHSTPLALRFVAGSKAFLSMARDEPHATVEMTLFRHQPGAVEAILSYERACLEACGRPHWGELHLLTGQPHWLRSAYRNFDKWHAAYRTLNPRHVFDNHFTDRVIKPALGG